MSTLQRTGHLLWQGVDGAGYSLDLLLRTLLQTVALPRKLRAVLDQMFSCGVRPLPVTAFVAVFSGMILALQTGIELRSTGTHTFIGNIVAVSMRTPVRAGMSYRTRGVADVSAIAA